MKLEWFVMYLLAWASILINRHFFGFELAVASALAWIVADLAVMKK